MKSILTQNKFRRITENHAIKFSRKSSTSKVFEESKFVLFSSIKFSISVF